MEWERITERVTGGRTVYWNARTGGWRLAVSRAESPGAWKFRAYRLGPHNKAGVRVHESKPVGTVAQTRRAAEAWLAEEAKKG